MHNIFVLKWIHILYTYNFVVFLIGLDLNLAQNKSYIEQRVRGAIDEFADEGLRSL